MLCELLSKAGDADVLSNACLALHYVTQLGTVNLRYF